MEVLVDLPDYRLVVVPGGNHHNTVLPQRPEVHVLLENEGGAARPQPTGLKVVSSKETIQLRLKTPNVQSVWHAGAGLVGLGHQDVVLGGEHQVLRLVNQVTDLIDLGLSPPVEHLDAVDCQVGPGSGPEDCNEAVGRDLDADHLLPLIPLTEVLIVPDSQWLELITLLPVAVEIPRQLLELCFVKFLEWLF